MNAWLQSRLWPVSSTQQQSPILTDKNNNQQDMASELQFRKKNNKEPLVHSEWNTDDESQDEASQEDVTHKQIKMDYQKNLVIIVSIFTTVTLLGSFISHYIVLLFGFLIPAYNTFKAIKLANSKLYVRWAMYWTVFGMMFTVFNITDYWISWFPMYQQFKCLLVYWLASPTQRGSSVVYRKFLHQLLEKNESNIDRFLLQKHDEVTEMIKDFGSRGIDVAGSFVREGSKTVLKVAAEKATENGYTKEKLISGLISAIPTNNNDNNNKNHATKVQ